MYENCRVKKFITNQFNNLLPVGLLHVARLVECCTCITEVKGSNLVQAWIFSGFLSTTAKVVACITGASWANWSECSILREARNECEERDEGRRKIKRLLCMVQFCLLPSPPPPRATPGTGPALQAQGWGIVWSSPVQGAGGSLWFCEVGAISHAV